MEEYGITRGDVPFLDLWIAHGHSPYTNPYGYRRKWNDQEMDFLEAYGQRDGEQLSAFIYLNNQLKNLKDEYGMECLALLYDDLRNAYDF